MRGAFYVLEKIISREKAAYFAREINFPTTLANFAKI